MPGAVYPSPATQVDQFASARSSTTPAEQVGVWQRCVVLLPEPVLHLGRSRLWLLGFSWRRILRRFRWLLRVSGLSTAKSHPP